MAIRADDVDVERDRDLVQRYQAGDLDAFDDLYRRYFARLHAYCRRRVGDIDAAEELAQEAFVRALRAMPRFGGERRFYPWMTVIAHRLCIDHHRRRARVEPAAEVELGAVEPELDFLDDAVDRQHLVQALDRLAPRHREVLELREAEALSYQQIADRLGSPISTVETLLHRARKALRREFRSVSGPDRAALVPAITVAWTERPVSAARRPLLRWALPALVGVLVAVATLGGTPAMGPAAVTTVSVPHREPAQPAASVPATVDSPAQPGVGSAPASPPAAAEARRALTGGGPATTPTPPAPGAAPAPPLPAPAAPALPIPVPPVELPPVPPVPDVPVQPTRVPTTPPSLPPS